MVGLEKQLESAQRFLAGVRALASYEDIEQKQLKGLLIALCKCKDLSTSQAAALLEGIDPRIWSEGAVEELQREIAAKTSQVEVDKERTKMQDFSQIPRHLTPELARMILEGPATSDQILQALCVHAGRMSLRVPSEFTIAVLVTLSNWKQIQGGLTEQGKYLLLQDEKLLVRKRLVALNKVANGILALPMDPAELPQNLRQAAFGNGAPFAMDEVAVAVIQEAKTMPLRGTNRSVSLSSTTRRGAEEGSADWTVRAITAAVQGAVAASRSLGNGSTAARAASLTRAAREVRPQEMLALTNVPHAEMMAEVSTRSTGAPLLGSTRSLDVGLGSTRAVEAQADVAPGSEAVPETHGDVEVQLAALWDAAPKPKAQAKSLSKSDRLLE